MQNNNNNTKDQHFVRPLIPSLNTSPQLIPRLTQSMDALPDEERAEAAVEGVDGVEGEEAEEEEANQLLDETQRLRHKRDLLTKENEQLKTYLRLRQMESTATCEQLKSEIEQQIEQFEQLGDTQTNHLETLKSFRSEIEAIQCWNAKIRNKYFSRNPEASAATAAQQLTDEYIQTVVATTAATNANKATTDGTNDDTDAPVVAAAPIASASRSTDCDNDVSKRVDKRPTSKRKAKSVSSDGNDGSDLNRNANVYKITTRSKHKTPITTSDSKSKRSVDKSDDKTPKTSKRKKN